MKRVRFAVVLACVSAVSVLSQSYTPPLGRYLEFAPTPCNHGIESQPAQKATTPTPPSLRDWPVVARDDTSNIRQLTQWETNRESGELKEKVHTVIEVAGGLNYLDTSDGSATWRETQDLIELLQSGEAAATKGPHKLYCRPDLKSEAAIAIQTKQGRVILTRPLGIYFVDEASGSSVELAQINAKAEAELIPPNQIVWRHAFNSEFLTADLRLTYTKLGIESDVIYTSNIKVPEAFGLNPETTLLQVRHEFKNAPTPRKFVRQLGKGLEDESFEMDGLLFPTGKAFPTGTGAARELGIPATLSEPWLPDNDKDNTLAVQKRWLQQDDGAVLLESVAWENAASLIKELPDVQIGDIRNASSLIGTVSDSKFKVATAGYNPAGFVMDYLIIGSGTSISFQTDQTYLISGSVSFSGTVTFQGGCVVKYAPGTYLMISGTGTVSCQGGASNPSILTCRDDYLFPQIITLQDGDDYCPEKNSNTKGIWYCSQTTPANIKGLRCRWLGRAVVFDTGLGCSGGWTYLSDTVFESCGGAFRSINTLTYQQGGILVRDMDGYGGVWVGCPAYSYPFTAQDTLQRHIVKNTQWLGTTANPNDFGRPIFGTADGPINTWCWIYQKPGFNSVSRTPYSGPCTLVTPHYALGAWHQGGTAYVGSTLTWLGRDNVIYSSVCTGVRRVGTTDIMVMAFSNPPPTSQVDRCKILPANATSKMPLLGVQYGYYDWDEFCAARRTPAITVSLTTLRTTRSLDIWSLSSGMAWFVHADAQDQPCLTLPDWDSYYISGDCGHPIWFYINGELVYVGTFYSGDTGPWPGSIKSQVDYQIGNQVNGLAKELGLPNEPLVEMDLNAFPDL